MKRTDEEEIPNIFVFTYFYRSDIIVGIKPKLC